MKVSPTTLRYAVIAHNIVDLLKIEDGCRIAEIGVGYGGQCFCLNKLVKPSKYTLFDLPEVTQLSTKYLQKLGVENVEVGNIEDVGDYDLVISNYAFTELEKWIQDKYLENVIKRSKKGYIIANMIGSTNGYSHDDLMQHLWPLGARELPEIPRIRPENSLIVW